MKKHYKYILGFLALFALIIACTKEVGLYTEVEFEISETHVAEGFMNTPLATSITVTPEELVEGYSYTYSYKINSGEGYFQDESGAIISEGDKIGLNPLSAALNYIATRIGDHSITFTAEDTFGFQEQVTASYTISDVPVSWTATGPTGQVLLGTSQDITVILGSETTATGVTYERNYSFIQGTGNITSSPSGANETLNEFVSISPDTFALTYVSTELGQTTLEFLLKDSNGQEILQTISFEVVDELSTEKEITSFIVNGVAGTPSGTSINLVLPEGTDLTALSPVIIHTGASISPESETSQDFTNPVEYTVMAQDGSIQIWNVTITNSTTALTSVIIDQYTDTMTVNGSQTLTATITPSNASNQTITWSSDDETIAIINSAGEVEAIAAGTVSIKASVDGVFDTVEITVSPLVIPVISVTIDTYTDNMTVNDSQTLTATITPSNASIQTITWTSSDETIAIISNSGEVEAIAAGTVFIKAAVDGEIDTVEITVSPLVNPVISVSIDSYTDTMTVNESQTLTATITPSNASNQTITWSSSNEAIATINSSGEVEAITTGTFLIKAAVDGKIDTVEITVVNQTPTALPDNYSVIKGTNNNLFNVIANDSDPDGDMLTVTLELFPLNGTATMSGNQVSYSPNINFVGTDQIGYQISDGNGGMASGSITVTVNSSINNLPNSIPTIRSRDNTVAPEDVLFTGVSSTDSDGEIIQYQWNFGDLASGTDNEYIGYNSGESNILHTFNSPGIYTITLIVTDNDGGTDTSTITITVEEPIPTAIFSSENEVRSGEIEFVTGTLTISNGAVGFTLNAFGGTAGTNGVKTSTIYFNIEGVASYEIGAEVNENSSGATGLIPPGIYTYVLQGTFVGVNNNYGSITPNL
ncbi:Ig-like domain-containing protein [Cellulophaga sp. E16_2]|uniref:Ig-like domain-containing protein n=1 Tax=Cellulophaga sp. E16_2 TaxID=2789297 RepID=UPI001A91729C|nr:Ig-like domain-containing protein [Cellulophaga sp. E16_2]MBO0593404.1 Ig-like domain-containing protein [Cellulophaga sp. E16_2]